jgi:membrane protein implicated in regulation of membrane protease activity
MDRALRFSVLGLAGGFVIIVAAVVNALTHGAYVTPLLFVMLGAAVFTLVMVVSARLERRRVRKLSEPPKPLPPTMRFR